MFFTFMIVLVESEIQESVPDISRRLSELVDLLSHAVGK